ncbi:hypothetical protein VSU19_07940 [Verrucomicrobiales bacterium BCK34]|nr:hypothetical protein [Verrucomicrobiales bacterium BCK34]
MKLLLNLFMLVIVATGLSLTSCETVDSDPRPEREKLSSMPHNIPQSWEGQAGMPGFGGGGGY